MQVSVELMPPDHGALHGYMKAPATEASLFLETIRARTRGVSET